MTDTQWTEPVDLVDGEVSAVDKFNAEVHENLRHVHYAKAATLGRSSNLTVPHESFTSLAWDFATLETVNLWAASPFPERITVPVAGLWLFTVRIAWPPDNGVGVRSVRMQQQGVTTVGQDTRLAKAGYTLYSTFSAILEMDGVGSYCNFHAWQDSGGNITLSGGHRLDCVYLGAV